MQDIHDEFTSGRGASRSCLVNGGVEVMRVERLEVEGVCVWKACCYGGVDSGCRWAEGGGSGTVLRLMIWKYKMAALALGIVLFFSQIGE